MVLNGDPDGTPWFLNSPVRIMRVKRDRVSLRNSRIRDVSERLRRVAPGCHLTRQLVYAS